MENFSIDYCDNITIKFKKGWGELEGFYKNQEIETKHYFCSVIKEDWNIIDIGANIGMYSLLFDKLSNGKKFLIEGSEINFEMLKVNMSETQTDNNFFFNECVGQDDCVIENSTIHVLWTGKGSILTKTGNIFFRKVDTILSDFDDDINLIKIDVDGWDFEALRGCEKIIKKSNPIICIELFDETLKINNNSKKDVFDYMTALGYMLESVLDGQNHIFIKK